MTIDIHCHLFKSKDDVQVFESLIPFYAERLTALGRVSSFEEIKQEIYSSWVDPDGQKTISIIDKARIGKTVVLVAAFELDKGNVRQILEQRNRDITRITANYPDRLIPFCALHPELPGLEDFLVRCVTEWGVRGIKLDPLGGGFYPNDKKMYRIYEKACELSLPIVMHTGPRPEDPSAKNGHPFYLSQPLADFPEMRIVAAHMSFAWWRDLIKVARDRPNIMCDISAYQLTAAFNYGQFCHILRKIIDNLGSDKVLFGTDGPTFDIFIPRDEWVKLVEDLPRNSPESDRFTHEEVKALLHDNAERLLA
jgi:predicted TIM-barrel fold metal-dependent hydrolase